ncbi:MAG TPA: anti-sigma factor, partial [Candidatus Limnocylindria bacterium]|nr:anti-sigma factor [Candidatus Limnocylindria bacterium]
MAEHELAGLRCSDVLELSGSFVLGALEPDEMDAVREHLAVCPEAHAEIAELGGVVPALFEAVDLVAPPAGLRDRIMTAAAADTQRVAAPQLASDAARGVESPPATVKPFAPAADTQRERYPVAAATQRRGWDLGALFRRPIWAGVAMAAVVGVIALGAWNVQLRGDLDNLAAYRGGVVAVIDAAARPGAQLAVLTTPDASGGPSGLAAVGGDGAVALVMRDLAPTTGTQVYETWLIGADGKPVAIGGFQIGTGGTASFTTQHAVPGGGVTVALTLEPAPGATAPTGPIVAAGAGQAQQS